MRESKARLSELVSKANAGEDVVITVRGKPSARLVPLQSKPEVPDMRSWASELEARMGTESAAAADSSRDIIDALREDRW
ncbi:MAG TPA: type II toxin-antitoxin system prevent-host-death family antitoxin [Opitutales bacterium]|nr:type II toxin-antitoxin system prevent-host-death family antitoxin [Opitutales bacterium]